LCSHDFIGGYMKLTVEAFPQNQKSHSVHMKVVAASWAFAECNEKCGNNQNYKPDAKQSSHGPVGGRYLMHYQ
jgi:hypothetical protein